MDKSAGAERNTGWWITSLAISVTCCAVMFVIFGGYVADLRKDIAAQDVRIEELSQQQNTIMSEMDAIRHPSAEGLTQAPADSVMPKIDMPNETPGAMPSPKAPSLSVIPETITKP